MFLTEELYICVKEYEMWAQEAKIYTKMILRVKSFTEEFEVQIREVCNQDLP